MNKSYYLCGKEYKKDELLSFVSEKNSNVSMPLWEKEIYEFIQLWFDDSEYIRAHTSGTTGAPKEILLSKEEMVESALSTVGFFNLKEKDTALLCLSPSYIAGKMMIVRGLHCGLNLVFCDPGLNGLESIECKINFCAMVPYQVRKTLRNNPDIFDKIETLIVGGGAIGKELEIAIQNIPTSCYSTYGMTETMSHIALMKVNGNKDEAYVCLPGINVSCDDRSCLVIEYRGRQELITNDIVDIINEKRFIWKGRYDNVINSGGIKLMPETLERKISGIISERFIFSSLKDDELGERLVLLIEASEYSDDKLECLKKSLNDSLGKYEMPKEIIFVERFKETSSGKIIRRGFNI